MEAIENGIGEFVENNEDCPREKSKGLGTNFLRINSKNMRINFLILRISLLQNGNS